MLSLCNSASVCSDSEVRLFGGYSNGYGIAEVCIDGLWADICSYRSPSSSDTIARAFCRQHTGQQSSNNTELNYSVIILL